MSFSAQAYSKAWAQTVSRALDERCRGSLVAGRREVNAMVGQNRVDLVGNSPDDRPQEVTCYPRRHLLVQLDVGELRGAIDGHQEVEPSLLGADLGDVDMEVADRVSFELAPARLLSLDIWQA